MRKRSETAADSNAPSLPASRIPALDSRIPALRPLMIPSEHGAWGFLFEPMVLGLIVAPSLAGGAVAVAALAGFLARHPLKLALSDLLRGKRYSRTTVCAGLAMAYGAMSIAALLWATHLHGFALLLPLAIALPMAAFQFVSDLSKRGRALGPEIAGVAAMGAIATSIAVAGDRSMTLAASLWCLALLRSIPSIMFVRAALGKSGRTVAIATHLIAVAASVALWRLGLVPSTAILAMSLLLGRAVVSGSKVLPARSVGIRELGYGAATVLLMALGYHLM